jgi:hypothetical protein
MKNMKKITEPLAYIILVAAFGFLASVVNHSRSTPPTPEAQLMSFSVEAQLNEMLTGDKADKEISL